MGDDGIGGRRVLWVFLVFLGRGVEQDGTTGSCGGKVGSGFWAGVRWSESMAMRWCDGEGDVVIVVMESIACWRKRVLRARG